MGGLPVTMEKTIWGRSRKLGLVSTHLIRVHGMLGITSPRWNSVIGGGVALVGGCIAR